MTDLQSVLERCVARGDAPFLVAMTGNAAGTTFSGAAGEAAPGRPAAEDTVFRIFSMTKAVGSVAAMMMIERGKLSMDTPVAEVLPAFRDIKVLDGWNGDEPVLRAPRTECTIRHLATHTSGFCYEFWNPDVPRWMEKTGHPTIVSGMKAALNYPLAFDPGSRWDYGIGIDWLGQAVEADDGRRIDAFVTEEILQPLGMTSSGFECEGAMAARLADLKARGEDGQFAPFELAPPPQPEFYGMGHALYSTAPDYLRFCRMILRGGELDGARILSPESVSTMCANQIGDLTVGVMKTAAPPVTADVDLFPGLKKTHAFAFLRLEEDAPGMRSAGSLAWAGVCNTHYWIDPAKDLAAVIMTQSLPFAEPGFMHAYEDYERAVYATA